MVIGGERHETDPRAFRPFNWVSSTSNSTGILAELRTPLTTVPATAPPW